MLCFKNYLFAVSFFFFLAPVYGQRGSSCTTPNGETAQCISIHSCPILYNAVTTKDREQIKFLRESQCGRRRRDPQVCCGSYDNYRTQNSGENLFGDDPTPNWDRATNSGWDNSNRRTNQNSNNRRTSYESSDWGSGSNSGWGSSNRRTSSENSRWGEDNDRPQWGGSDIEDRRTNQGSNSKLSDRSSCGFQDTDKILDGQVTGLREFPWMALLQYRKKSGNLVFSCGGSLISSRYILTAAHCVKGSILTKIGPLVNVRLGEYNTDNENDCTNQLGFSICNDKPFDSDIEKVIVHPDYRDNSVDRYNDIALVKLKNDAPRTDFIKPICLPTNSERSRVGERLVVAGWGRTEYASSSPVKLKLWVPIAEKSQCSATFRSAGVNLGSKQICAGGERGKDSCNGDSGGPLMTTFKNDTAQWYIEGIVSFGAKCGTEGWPGIYTKVSEYIDWIRSNAI